MMKNKLKDKKKLIEFVKKLLKVMMDLILIIRYWIIDMYVCVV